MTDPTPESEKSPQQLAAQAAADTPDDTPPGLVWLVGAGPGDPGLITVAGLRALQQADVVVFDALANPALLAEAPEDAELIDVGKRAKFHKLTQDETNQLLVDLATTGKTVVRLKGGDPYLFGRGAEEAAYCARHGIPCEVIPGITSGLAAPATAGIPVTHRKVASTVTIVTGHEDPTKGETSVDYSGLAALIKVGGTVCFYMGVGRLQQICDELTSHGVASDMPAALIQWGTLPNQRHVTGTLANIKQKVDDAGLGSPAIIVVGKVVAIDEPGLDYFTARPLFGQRILVTRTRQQASELRQHLEDLGAQVYEAPTIEIVEPGDWSTVDHAIQRLSDYAAIVFTSANAVYALADRLDAAGLDSRALAGLHLSCIGDSTANALEDVLSIVADFIPEGFTSEEFAEELLAATRLKGKRVLLPQADIARPILGEKLRAGGCKVDELVIYENKPADALPEEVLEALRHGGIDWLTFTSSSTVRNLVDLLGDEAHLLVACKVASIGPKTSATVRDCGLPLTVEAQQHDVTGLIHALVDAVHEQSMATDADAD